MKEYFRKLKYLFSTKDLFFTVLIFVIIITMAFCKNAGMMDVTFGDTAVDIVTKQYSMNIPYDMVEKAELAEIPEENELIKGKGDITLKTGIWRNDSWGEFHACLDLQTKNCVLVHLNDGRLFVFSHDSDEATRRSCEMLNEKISQ